MNHLLRQRILSFDYFVLGSKNKDFQNLESTPNRSHTNIHQSLSPEAV